MIRKEKENDSLVNKWWKKDSSKKNDSLKAKIDERLKSIERSMIYTQNDSLAELIKTDRNFKFTLREKRERCSSFRYYWDIR